VQALSEVLEKVLSKAARPHPDVAEPRNDGREERLVEYGAAILRLLYL
jgi:hypothetical protein